MVLLTLSRSGPTGLSSNPHGVGMDGAAGTISLFFIFASLGAIYMSVRVGVKWREKVTKSELFILYARSDRNEQRRFVLPSAFWGFWCFWVFSLRSCVSTFVSSFRYECAFYTRANIIARHRLGAPTTPAQPTDLTHTTKSQACGVIERARHESIRHETRTHTRTFSENIRVSFLVKKKKRRSSFVNTKKTKK